MYKMQPKHGNPLRSLSSRTWPASSSVYKVKTQPAEQFNSEPTRQAAREGEERPWKLRPLAMAECLAAGAAQAAGATEDIAPLHQPHPGDY